MTPWELLDALEDLAPDDWDSPGKDQYALGRLAAAVVMDAPELAERIIADAERKAAER